MSIFIVVWKVSGAHISVGDTFKRVPIHLSGFFGVYPDCRLQIFNMKTFWLTETFTSSDKQDKCLSAQKPESTALPDDDWVQGLVQSWKALADTGLLLFSKQVISVKSRLFKVRQREHLANFLTCHLCLSTFDNICLNLMAFAQCFSKSRTETALLRG